MLKRDITYTNPFTEQEVTETHYFHISKADLIKMEMEEHGDEYVKDGKTLTGMQARLTRIVDSNDGKAIIREFEDIIRRAYGQKDGERFVKNDQISDEFLSSEAYSQLLWELCTRADAAAEFINGVVPGNLNEIAADVRKQAELRTKGIEAQAAAKVAGSTEPAAEAPEVATPTSHPSDPAATPADATLAERIAAATAENPARLSSDEVAALDSDELKTGLATGRIKLI